jgi:acetoacetyl-CoA synthetase
VPLTLSGKKLEVPVKKILMGVPVERAANPDSLRNPESLQFFVDLAQKLAASSPNAP